VSTFTIRRLGRGAPAGFAGAFLAVAFAVAAPSAAFAVGDDAEEPAVRWSVVPSSSTGADGRTAIEHTLDPGDSVEDHVAVRNVSTEDVTFGLTAADGFFTRAGRFDILPSGEESVAAGTWISVAESVVVPAGKTVVVPFTLSVPDEAEPGDHAAGLTASIISIQSADDGTAVGVESRVGVRVLTRVTGEIAPAASVQALSGVYATSWNPFRPGDITVDFTVVNEGNTRLLARGEVATAGQSVAFPGAAENEQELLPGDERQMTAVIDDVWPLFFLTTTVTVAAEVLTIDGSKTQFVPVAADVVVWAVPWPQLLLLLGVALIIGSLVWGRVRARRRLEARLSEAREEGRRDAEKMASAS
jgi:hypothetical protein